MLGFVEAVDQLGARILQWRLVALKNGCTTMKLYLAIAQESTAPQRWR